MALAENLLVMRQHASDMLEDFLLLWDGLLVREGDRAWVPYGSLPGIDRLPVSAETPPSSRLTCDVALGYLAAHLEKASPERRETAFSLLRHAFTQHHEDGYFIWNYGQREVDQVDLGTVLDTYWWFWTRLKELPDDIRDGIQDSTRRAIGYLKTVHQADHPGVIRKRAPVPDEEGNRATADYRKIDVLNGNALASTAYCRAATILEDPTLVDRGEMFLASLAESFGRHVPGWWVYVEELESRAVMTPESILYQAMTALYLEPLWRERPGKSFEKLLAASMTALQKITDKTGRLDWAREARKDFVETQLLMLPSAAAALADVVDVTDAARRRMEFVTQNLYDREAHWFIDESGDLRHGEPADELRQIWAASDLALIILHARRRENALSAS
jgi:hypothetical protein